MARTQLATQRLSARAGVQITFSPFDVLNGHQYRNTGVEVVLVRLDSGSAVTINVPSVADPFARFGDVGPSPFTGTIASGAFPPSTVFALGPFSPVQNWGDGASQNQLNESAVSGSGGIAVVAI